MTRSEIIPKMRPTQSDVAVTERLPFSIWPLALSYLGAITFAEALTTLGDPRVGLVLHGVILVALLLHAALAPHRLTRTFLLALALTPLIRLLSLALPLSPFPQIYWYMLVGVPLFLAAFFAARTGGLSFAALGLNLHKLPIQVLISFTGIGLGYLEYTILTPKPLVADLRLELIWQPALILLIFTGLLEEVIFRGLLQYTALQSLGRGGLLYQALIFAVLHMGYRSLQDVVFVFVVAMFFGWAVQRSGSILGVTLAHGLTNISLFLIFPFFIH